MDIEYEATFPNVNKEVIRKKLKAVGAKLVRPEFFQRRVAFRLPKGHDPKGSWARVRDESDKITMSIKIVTGSKIEDTKEAYLVVNDFKNAQAFLELLGCKPKAYQESKRELWVIDGAEVTIDEWPFLEPFVEVEASSEKKVKSVSKKLGFDYSTAVFGPVTVLYSRKYKISEDRINYKTPRIVFNEKNPFL